MDKSKFIIKPENMICNCIICHEQGVEASDEHIIPKSIGGYLHTWNVCKTCNSILGDHVDDALVNQKLVQFERYKYQIKGQSNTAVPHPFAGVFQGEDGKQYRIEDKEGVLTPHIIGAKPVLSADGKQMSFSIDAKDSNQIRGIVEKYCKRNKLTVPTEWPEYEVKSAPAPFIQVEFNLNFSELKLAMLKIAYEFTACMIPEYVDDTDARLISGILKEAAANRVDEVDMDNNILQDGVFEQMFGKFIDFSKNSRHYILLTNIDGKLYCSVKLFSLFCASIKMSDREYAEIKDPIIVINDFVEHNFDIFALDELIAHIQTGTQTGVRFVEPYNKEFQAISDQISFYADNDGHNLCFDLSGKYIGTDIEVMSNAMDEDIETTIGEMETKSIYHIKGRLCFALAPLWMMIPIEEIVLVTAHEKY